MKPIDRETVQSYLDSFRNKELYYHMETSNGSYASLESTSMMSVCAFVRNAKIQYLRGTTVGEGPYKVGLKMDDGWLYAEGLTDFEYNEAGQLLMGGYDSEGRVNIALELSLTPFEMEEL